MYINNAIYATRPQVAIVQTAHDSVTASKIFQLKTEIVQLWVSGKQNLVQTGHKLRLLQNALARHGHGTFLKAIKDTGDVLRHLGIESERLGALGRGVRLSAKNLARLKEPTPRTGAPEAVGEENPVGLSE